MLYIPGAWRLPDLRTFLAATRKVFREAYQFRAGGLRSTGRCAKEFTVVGSTDDQSGWGTVLKPIRRYARAGNGKNEVSAILMTLALSASFPWCTRSVPRKGLSLYEREACPRPGDFIARDRQQLPYRPSGGQLRHVAVIGCLVCIFYETACD